MKELINKSEQYIFPTYTRLPIVLTRGEGMKVWDSEGKETSTTLNPRLSWQSYW